MHGVYYYCNYYYCYYYYYYYYLTAVGLPPGGSTPTLVQTKIKIHKITTKQRNKYKTVKISAQTEHRKCKCIHVTKTNTYITKHVKLKQP